MRPSASVIRSDSAFIQASMRTSPLSMSCAIATTRPSSSYRSLPVRRRSASIVVPSGIGSATVSIPTDSVRCWSDSHETRAYFDRPFVGRPSWFDPMTLLIGGCLLRSRAARPIAIDPVADAPTSRRPCPNFDRSVEPGRVDAGDCPTLDGSASTSTTTTEPRSTSTTRPASCRSRRATRSAASPQRWPTRSSRSRRSRRRTVWPTS